MANPDQEPLDLSENGNFSDWKDPEAPESAPLIGTPSNKDPYYLMYVTD